MPSKVIPVDFLRTKKKGETVPSETVLIPKRETKAQKILRLEGLIEQDLYEPNLEDVAEALINKLAAEEAKK